jgi:hypothetical protein
MSDEIDMGDFPPAPPRRRVQVSHYTCDNVTSREQVVTMLRTELPQEQVYWLPRSRRYDNERPFWGSFGSHEYKGQKILVIEDLGGERDIKFESLIHIWTDGRCVFEVLGTKEDIDAQWEQVHSFGREHMETMYGDTWHIKRIRHG